MSEPTYFELGPDAPGRDRIERLPSGRLVTFYRGKPAMNPITDPRDFRYLIVRGYVQVVKGDDGKFVPLGEAKERKAVTRAAVAQVDETAKGNGEPSAGLAGPAPVTSGTASGIPPSKTAAAKPSKTKGRGKR